MLQAHITGGFSDGTETSQVFASGLFTSDVRNFRFTKSNCRMIANSELEGMRQEAVVV
jgi:hypothetical protein